MLKDGEKTIKYFYMKANQRRHKKEFLVLKTRGGNWCDKTDDIVSMMERYFDTIFSSSLLDAKMLGHVIDAVHPRINSKMQEMLSTPYRSKEIQQVVFDMGLTKAPCLNGFHAMFY